MKVLISTLVVIFSIAVGLGAYQSYQKRQIEKYWLKMANNAVVNNDVKFIEFYEDCMYSLHTLSIEEGWNLYERYCNK